MLGSIGDAIGKAVGSVAGSVGKAIGGAAVGAIFGDAGGNAGSGSSGGSAAPAAMSLGQYKMQPNAGSTARAPKQAKVTGQASIGADPVSFYGSVIQKALSGQ